ncbi:MAG: hypothetical protein M1831_005321 [Alyxoria varia]|nr:MAG: hypothetical protein M1831_005321 [Alyxoria varia]
MRVRSKLQYLTDNLLRASHRPLVRVVRERIPLASTAIQPLFSQLANAFGWTRPLLGVVTVFVAGGLMGGFANGEATLIDGRALRGVGTGEIDLLGELIMCDLVAVRQRGVYSGMKQTVFVSGVVADPVVGGVLARRNSGGWAQGDNEETVTMLDSKTSMALWVIFQLLVAIGSGVVILPLLPNAQMELHDADKPAVAGTWVCLRSLAAVFGVSKPGVIFNVEMGKLVSTILDARARKALAGGEAWDHTSAASPKEFSAEVNSRTVDAFAESLRVVWVAFVVSAGVWDVACVCREGNQDEGIFGERGWVGENAREGGG